MQLKNAAFDLTKVETNIYSMQGYIVGCFVMLYMQNINNIKWTFLKTQNPFRSQKSLGGRGNKMHYIFVALTSSWGFSTVVSIVHTLSGVLWTLYRGQDSAAGLDHRWTCHLQAPFKTVVVEYYRAWLMIYDLRVRTEESRPLLNIQLFQNAPKFIFLKKKYI